MKKMTALVAAILFLAGAFTVRADTLPAGSLYNYQTVLADQDGKKVGLDVFAGHPVIVSMFYASCDYSCPLLIDLLKKTQARLKASAGDNIRILLITFDPKKDVPEELQKLAAKHGVDLKIWKFVQPKPEAVREIAALLNFTYRALPEGGFNHSSIITLLDEKGVVIHSEEGLKNAADAIVDILKKREVSR